MSKETLHYILLNADKPLVAADLAQRLHLIGSRETQRRKVRALIKKLRDEGNWIIATIWEGYKLTKDFSEWREYNERCTIGAKRIFKEVSQKKEKAKAAYQPTLF
jgi:biotin operon repressor